MQMADNQRIILHFDGANPLKLLKHYTMTQQEQLKHFEALTAEMKQILFKKGNDYANTDRLSNFKLAGAICGLTAERNCLTLIATKVARLGVLLNTENKPNNESIHDSIVDLANYSVLLSMIMANK